jgi:chromosome segregation ATPase
LNLNIFEIFLNLKAAFAALLALLMKRFIFLLFQVSKLSKVLHKVMQKSEAAKVELDDVRGQHLNLQEKATRLKNQLSKVQEPYSQSFKAAFVAS